MLTIIPKHFELEQQPNSIIPRIITAIENISLINVTNGNDLYFSPSIQFKFTKSYSIPHNIIVIIERIPNIIEKTSPTFAMELFKQQHMLVILFNFFLIF